MISFRPATKEDIPALWALDPLAQSGDERRQYIQHKVAAGTCHVALSGGQIAGYGVLEYTFFEYGFVAMLMVHPGMRRGGVGQGLMRHFEALCTTPKLFTSTNLSNLPMQGLLARLGYELAGVIHRLDEGDPELVYVKVLAPLAERRAPGQSLAWG